MPPRIVETPETKYAPFGIGNRIRQDQEIIISEIIRYTNFFLSDSVRCIKSKTAIM
jgi:hypothetical protein